MSLLVSTGVFDSSMKPELPGRLQQHSGDELLQAGFDGAYTYFAADGFTFGSTGPSSSLLLPSLELSDATIYEP